MDTPRGENGGEKVHLKPFRCFGKSGVLIVEIKGKGERRSYYMGKIYWHYSITKKE